MNYRKILLSTAILAFSFHHAQNLKLNPTSAEERWKGYEQRKKLEENYQFLDTIFKSRAINWGVVSKMLCGNKIYLKETDKMNAFQRQNFINDYFSSPLYK